MSSLETRSGDFTDPPRFLGSSCRVPFDPTRDLPENASLSFLDGARQCGVARGLLGLIAVLWGTLSFALAAPPGRPNIVILLADDLGIGDPGCYNPDSKIATPNIDRIAREGMRFSDVHSASSVCSPTRYAILTGRYAWRTRMKRASLAAIRGP